MENAAIPAVSMYKPVSNRGNHQINHSRGNNILKRGTPGAAAVVERYRESSVSIRYQNADGDSISISMKQQRYQRAIMAAGGKDGSDASRMDELVLYMKEEIASQKSMLIEITFGGKKSEKVDKESELENLPEYWNAENTSQRIVDFATSFLGAFEGAPDEFVSMIRDAIDEGFSSAREFLGELPDAVEDLVGDTYTMVMDKLDAWEEGLTSRAEQEQEQA